MHYKNGREAHVGDIVYGTTYNGEKFKKPYVGILITVTPGNTTCNCTVAGSLSVLPLSNGSVLLAPSFKSANGPHFPDVDYGEVGQLLHIDDYIKSLQTVEVVDGEDAPVI